MGKSMGVHIQWLKKRTPYESPFDASEVQKADFDQISETNAEKMQAFYKENRAPSQQATVGGLPSEAYRSDELEAHELQSLWG